MYTSHPSTKMTSSLTEPCITPVEFQCLCTIHSDLETLHTDTHTHTHTHNAAQTQGCVFTQTSSQPPLTTHGRAPSYLASPWANNTSHVQVSINRSFDGGCWEFQGGGVHAGIPGVPTGGGGGMWSSFRTGGEK